MFVKNDDDIRVKVVCKRKCGFFKKTLIDAHTCCMVFKNHNANKDWVSKVGVEKFRHVR